MLLMVKAESMLGIDVQRSIIRSQLVTRWTSLECWDRDVCVKHRHGLTKIVLIKTKRNRRDTHEKVEQSHLFAL